MLKIIAIASLVPALLAAAILIYASTKSDTFNDQAV